MFELKLIFPICCRSFVQRAKLIRHQRIHSKGFCQCPLCNRTLESEEQLDRHLKIHELRKLKLSGVVGIVVPRNTVTPRKKAPPKPRKERKTPAPLRKLQCSYCEKRFPYQVRGFIYFQKYFNLLGKQRASTHSLHSTFICFRTSLTSTRKQSIRANVNSSAPRLGVQRLTYHTTSYRIICGVHMGI